MSKIGRVFFSIIFFFIWCSASSQSTPIPDPNFEAQLIALGYDSNGANGNILNSDADLVTNLTTNRNDITNFDGLQAFRNLIELNLDRNQFTTLPMSNLTGLERLTFRDNEVLASLDLTRNVNLKWLDIQSIPAINTSTLTTLDLSANIRLEHIHIFNFQDLETIVLPRTKTLTYLDIKSNFDLIADTSYYDNLEFLDIEVFRGMIITLTLPQVKTNLRSIRVANGEVIDFRGLGEFVNLEKIILFTRTEFIEFPQSNSLTDVQIIPHYIATPVSFNGVPNLNSLTIGSSKVETPFIIDLGSNSELEILVLKDTKLVNLDLSGNPKLRLLEVKENNLEELDLSKNSELESVIAFKNLITNIDLRNSNKITVLDLSDNRLEGIDLSQNTVLEDLNVSKNLFSGEGPDITQNTELVKLNMANNSISTLDITSCLKLESVDLSFNQFSGNNILEQIVQNYQTAGRTLGEETYALNDNLLSNTIPDFTSLVSTTTRNFSLNFQNNNFHFGDFEQQHAQYLSYRDTPRGGGTIFKRYWYAGQNKVNVREVITTVPGQPITLATVVRGARNHYKWFKDGVEIPGAADAPEYTISSPESCESGIYYAEITSDLVPLEDGDDPGNNGRNLVLQRNDLVLGANGVPTCALLISPLNKSVDVPINTGIEWESESGACGFLLSVGSTSGASDILDALDVGNVSGYNFENNLPPDSEIFVTITPYFEDGSLDGCLEESFFTSSEATVPDCAILTQPLAGSVGVDANTNINWSVASGASGYRIRLGTSSGASDLANTNIDDGSTSYDPIDDFVVGSEVFVTITSFNDVGDAIGCDESSFFIASADALPPCTNLSRPLNGELEVNANTIIRWNRVGNASGYVLNIGTSAFGTDILSRDVGSEIEFQLDNNLPNEQTIFVTVIPYNTQGSAEGCVSESFETAAETPLPECTTLISPANGERDVDPLIDLAWNISENATGYIIEVGTTPDGDDFFSQDVGLTTFYNFRDDLPEGRPIYVKIIPYNETGEAVDCQGESFSTSVPTRPECTSLALPENGAINVSTTTNFAWNAISTAKGYTLNIGTTMGGSDILSEDVGATTFFDLPDSLPEEQIIYVSIVPYNDSGDAIDCIEESFTTSGAIVLPECTNLTMPTDGTTEVPVTTSLAWNAISNAEGYRVIIGTSSGASDVFSEDVGIANAISLPENLPENSSIYVLVTPYNAIGDALSCSEETFTTTAAPITPSCANLTMPTNGGTAVSMSTNFAWSAVANASGYFLNIGTSTNGTDIFSEDIGLTNFYDLAQDLPPSTVIYVSIVPYNNEGSALACTEDSFTTASVPTIPSCTSLSLPINGEMSASTFTNFAWNLVDNAQGYTLQIGTSSGGSEIFSGDVGSTTWYDLENELPESTEIFVTIGAYNDLGEAQGCLEESFTTADAPTVPSCSLLISPVEGSRAVDPNTRVVWNAVSDADGYRLSVGTTAGGTDIIDNQDVGLLTEFSLNGGFPTASQIYVTIAPYNVVGENLNCSSQSFTTAASSTDVVPFCTSLYEPIDGQSNIQTETTLRWNEVSNTDGYRISIGTTSGENDILDNFDVGSSTSYDVEGLPIGAIIYVQIKPYNAQGIQEGCQETKFITTFVEPSKNETKFALTPNGDGLNDFWRIEGIEAHPNNIVRIFNRWGDEVFKINGYNNLTNVFSGEANQMASLGAGQLPTGTYFFDIRIDGEHDIDKLRGYLILKR
ncbi:T9SS type B sorting domain-containing protein [Maribacter algarum]|uniref:T9SS type B sorting domain-containing protein n=1 Tax=Maribacter algarum (ex Zhang et al. 2020) TaxID=2578118 RepID=A0A5S3PTF6_9FLAO|nr:gliding motility-associated C-terminal domain-containing protein [Maribacter algarum]TMM58210.1 T9SS type B sorting domain-containing protein [Maribacter algarum]